MNETAPARGEPLTEALERLRLEGAIFLRAEYTERWALGDQGGPLFAAMMHPGAQRLILFHVVASGRCFVSCADGERYWANAGEVIVLPYGDVFLMGGVEPVEPVSIMSVVPPPPWTEMRPEGLPPCVRGPANGGTSTGVVRRQRRVCPRGLFGAGPGASVDQAPRAPHHRGIAVASRQRSSGRSRMVRGAA